MTVAAEEEGEREPRAVKEAMLGWMVGRRGVGFHAQTAHLFFGGWCGKKSLAKGDAI